MKPDEIYEGQKVIVARESGRIRWDSGGKMRQHIGEEVTVKSIKYDGSRWEIRIKEDPQWYWNPGDFDPALALTSVSDEDFEAILIGGCHV